ncbi:hypothetical protein QTN47_01480 [Danxiaibacter flavus]|uniref:Uncharacterized protein n=1 Tax=Danxiaibacter flavus TaxID=3049108 RepID=A0ABV3Z8F2_9BACT|nr:hypothetical protein QNM32_01480 [Chitinophagaceae bacterium DXS]
MKSGKNFEISLEELSSRNRRILAQQSETSYAEALKQVQQLKANSKVGQSLKARVHATSAK